MRKSNYDKTPSTHVDGKLWSGTAAITSALSPLRKGIWAVECYQGVRHDELRAMFEAMGADRFIDTATLMRGTDAIAAMTHTYLTDDRIFGRRNTLTYLDFFDSKSSQSAAATSPRLKDSP